MKTVNLQVEVDEVNLILEALGNLPFVRVYALIAKIQQQAGQQLQADEPGGAAGRPGAGGARSDANGV